jgi:subtilisin family serine protease
MKTVLLIAIGLALACHLPVVPAAISNQGKISSEVQSAMAAASLAQEISVIVYLNDRADLAPFRNLRRTERLRSVVNSLQNKAVFSQRSLKALLELRRGQGQVGAYKSFWVFNGFSVAATPGVIRELAARADVERIEADAVNIVPAAMPPEPNLSVIGAPDVWNLGFYGQGVVVASLDSGVDNTHPDLANRWRGGSNSWYDPYAQHATPYDPTGHGTWTMGLMVGGDAGVTSIGVAPGAQWIAAKIFNDSGTATATGIHQAFQWILDPDGNPVSADAPQVVNNSWAYGFPGCNLAFRPDLQALVSAGIVPVFAAGNYGPGGSTSVSPANYPEAFAVGATNNLDQLYAYSGKGPSACGEASTVYPELVAPGVNISTTDLFGFYTSQSGTSVAAPHVAGGLALLLSAYPELTAAQQRNALLLSAVDLGTPGPDNSFGYGRLNLPAAYDWLVLNAGTPPPPVDASGPDTSGVSVSPNPNNGTLGFDINTPAVRVAATVADPVINGLQSNIRSAEVFVDSVGSNGSGLVFLASDGSYDSPVETVYADIPLTTVAQLAEGSHVLYVHGQDSAGNWGAVGSVALIIDKTPPTVGNVAATLANTTINLTATAADPAPGSIGAAEWFEGNDPGTGLGHSMSVSGGTVAAAIDAGTWTPGSHTLFVRARDSAGNWSAAVSANINTALPNVIFIDSFESGGFTAWNGGATGSRISVNTAAKMTVSGIYGMQAALGGGTAPGYVADGTPALEKSYHARFYFNPHSANPGAGQVTIFSGLNETGTTIFQVQFKRNGSSYQVRGAVLRSGGTAYTNWFAVANNAAHPIEVAWQSGTSASFQFYTDGALKQTLSALNTSAYVLDTVRLGASAGLVNAASGTLYFDAFASTRTTVIGP